MCHDCDCGDRCIHEGGDNDADVDRAALCCCDRHRRRLLLFPVLLLTTGGPALLPIQTAQARGLVQFPLRQPLFNTYHLMRAGTSLLEEQDIYSTNPLFLTNREDAMSPLGQDQVVRACQLLQKQQQLLPTVIRFSLAAACIDAANVVARELRLGRDRVVAEYTYLDPRAVGRWDMLARSAVQPAIWALDNDQAGPDGTRGRPPPNEDGTPHETLADAAVRLRQLVSVLETQYSGDTILLIFPDGTGPALLSAMMAGIPLNRVHELEFDSGELRTNVTVGSILELWKARQDGESAESYREALDRGRATLQQLQSTSPDAIVSKKDQQIEAERLELEREFQEKKRAQQLRTEQENVARAERRSRLEAQRKSSSSPTTKVDPALLGIAGSALAGGGVAIAVYSSSSSAPPGAVELVTQAENERSTSSPGENQEGVPPAAHPGSTLLVQVQRVNGDRNGSLRFASEGGSSGRSSSSLSGAPLYPPSGSPTPASLPPLSPLEAAQKAMDEYMNRDDGAADWLQSLVDILDESEMDDDDGDNKSHDGAMPG